MKDEKLMNENVIEERTKQEVKVQIRADQRVRKIK